MYDQLGNRKGANQVASLGAVTMHRRDNGLNQYQDWTIGTQPSPNQTGEIRIDSGEVISVEDWSATGAPKTMFKAKVQLPSRKPKDPSDRDFHFVIHKNRLEAIDPNVRVEKIYKGNQ